MRRRPNRTPAPLLLATLAGLTARAAGPTPDTAATPPACDADNGGITLPPGFCALVVADGLGRARHLAVAPNGDIFVAVYATREREGGLFALRDTTGDGRADIRIRIGETPGSGLALDGEHLVFGADDAVLRYTIPAGSLEPAGPPDTIVADLPAYAGHRAQLLVLDRAGGLFVNIGSPGNA